MQTNFQIIRPILTKFYAIAKNTFYLHVIKFYKTIQYLKQGDPKDFSSYSFYSQLYCSCDKDSIEKYVDRYGFRTPKVQEQSIKYLR